MWVRLAPESWPPGTLPQAACRWSSGSVADVTTPSPHALACSPRAWPLWREGLGSPKRTLILQTASAPWTR
jgi:hypothetical protein